MALHWSKFQLISVGREFQLQTPSGDTIPTGEALQYLGVDIRSDGNVSHEIHRKIGQAWGEFCKLNIFWKRTALPLSRKVEVFEAVIVSRLLYGLNSAWLRAADVRRVNGFYCRCLRVILRIQPSYISRVSNKTVLEKAGRAQISCKLLQQQLLLYGRVVRALEGDELKKRTFIPGTCISATERFVKKVGRPRNEWVSQVAKHAAVIGENIHCESGWRAGVSRHCMP